MMATVAQVQEDDRLVLQVADGVRMKFSRQAVQTVLLDEGMEAYVEFGAKTFSSKGWGECGVSPQLDVPMELGNGDLLTPWDLERRREYLDWAVRVVDQCRGVQAKLDSIFDASLAAARRRSSVLFC